MQCLNTHKTCVFDIILPYHNLIKIQGRLLDVAILTAKESNVSRIHVHFTVRKWYMINDIEELWARYRGAMGEILKEWKSCDLLNSYLVQQINMKDCMLNFYSTTIYILMSKGRVTGKIIFWWVKLKSFT